MSARRHRVVVGRFLTVRRTAFLLLSGLAVLTPAATFAQPQDAPAGQTPSADPYASHIAEAARRFGVSETWIRAVMRVESRGNVRATSPKGAMGLMQIMPATWTSLRARHGLGTDPYDPRDNILAGAAYLREMHDRYGSPGFLAAYNAGPGRYDEHRATGRPLPAETRAYVAALAPILGGAAPSDAPLQPPAPPPDWREAPLFVMRPADTRAASAPPSEAQSGDGRAAVPAHDPARAEPQDGSIFVASASDGGTP